MVPVLATAGDANPEETADTLRSSIIFGSETSARRKFTTDAANDLAARPDLVLDICVLAADTAFCMDWSSKLKKGTRLGPLLDSLVARAQESNPKHAALRWAAVETRVFHMRVADAEDPGAATELVREVQAIVETTEGSPLARRGVLRGAELLLEAAERKARAPAVVALEALAGNMADPQVSATARAALLLAKAGGVLDDSDAVKQLTGEALALLAPHLKAEDIGDHAIRRHNDFVTLIRESKIPIRADYHLVAHRKSRSGLRFRIPLSRRWRVAEAKNNLTIRLVTDQGRLRSRIWIAHYEEALKLKYPVGDPKGVHPKSVAKMALAYMNRDRARLKVIEENGPHRKELSSGIRAAHYYDIAGQSQIFGFRRLRAWFFRRRGRTYAIRIEDFGDFGERVCPEAVAFLKTFRA